MPARHDDCRERHLSRASRPRGFTLVEILIVVIILGILATLVVVQVESAVEDSAMSTMLTNQQDLNLVVQRYRVQHGYVLPTGTDQLLSKTDADGNIDSSGEFGPYLHEIPLNTLNDSRDFQFVTDLSLLDMSVSSGWFMDMRTGQVAGGTQ